VPGTLALTGGDEFPRAMRGGVRRDEPAAVRANLKQVA
jgi:hypothetical protein